MPNREFPILKFIDSQAGEFCLGANFYSIGRAADRNIRLLSNAVSRYHAHLYRGLRRQRYTIADGDGEEKNSTLGTWVNGMQLEFPMVLRHGDRVRLGDVELVYLDREISQPDPFDTLKSVPN